MVNCSNLGSTDGHENVNVTSNATRRISCGKCSQSRDTTSVHDSSAAP